MGEPFPVSLSVTQQKPGGAQDFPRTRDINHGCKAEHRPQRDLLCKSFENWFVHANKPKQKTKLCSGNHPEISCFLFCKPLYSVCLWISQPNDIIIIMDSQHCLRMNFNFNPSEKLRVAIRNCVCFTHRQNGVASLWLRFWSRFRFWIWNCQTWFYTIYTHIYVCIPPSQNSGNWKPCGR